MVDYKGAPDFELICVIVNYGWGSRVLHKAKEYGILGGTILFGQGTVNSSLLKFLSIYSERKEIVLMGTDKHTSDIVLDKLNKEFQFQKPNHGIVFTTSINTILGSSKYKRKESEKERGAIEPMYQIIVAIVYRGKAEDVIEAAKAAGSKGGTIVNARGSGTHETSKFFNMEIEPEKEIVMIISKEEETDTIIKSIHEKLEFGKPGNGLLFVQDVNKVLGIYK